jgi:hypothetical protein
MTRAIKIIGISFGLILLLLFGVGYFLFSDMCANTIVNASTSPNGKWKVVLFERNCGATTGFSSQISLIKADAELNNEAGNIYIADGYPKGYTLKWESDTTVKLSGAYSKNYKKETQLNGVQFSYE